MTCQRRNFTKRHSLMWCVIALLLSLPSPKVACAEQVGDPAIGSYFYFVALDRKCPQKSAQRTAALDRYRLNFLAVLKEIAASAPEAAAALDSLRKNGPDAEDLRKFDQLFAQFSAAELKGMCDSAPEDIATWIEIQEKLMESLKRVQELLQGAKALPEG